MTRQGPARPRRFVWHPFAFAAWPVVNLYRDNIGETPPREAFNAVLLAVLVTGVVLALLTLVLRDIRRAGLLTSLTVVTIMLYGAARDSASEAAWLLPVWLVAFVVLAAGAVRIRRILPELTTVLSGLGAIVLLLALLPVVTTQVPAWATTRSGPAQTEDLESRVGQWSAPGEPRDIYYLIFDRYGSQDAMERRWGMDLDGFFSDLRRRGFFVAGDSKANHLRTAQSLASSLNLQYLDDLAQRYGPDTANQLPVYQRLQDNAVQRILRSRGYEYAHVGAWWDPTQENPHADVNYGFERRSDFELALFRSTLLSVFERRPTGRSLAEHSRRTSREGTLKQFQDVRQAASRPGPTFTFAHFLLPHEPFVFDRDGNYISRDEEGRRGRTRNYVEQTQYANKLISELLDDLLAVPEAQRPIIILQADEGPHPVRFKQGEETFDWPQASDAELEEKFAILNAYLLPGAPEGVLYESISPVNTWRVVFNTYFGADLALLPDRSFVFKDERRVYDFTEITDRLGKPIGMGSKAATYP